MNSKRDDSRFNRWASHCMRLTTISLSISKHGSFKRISKIRKSQHQNLNISDKKIRTAITVESMNSSRHNLLSSSFIHVNSFAIFFKDPIYICKKPEKMRIANKKKKKKMESESEIRVPNLNAGWFGMKIVSEESFQGLVFASSVVSGRALTETWILSISPIPIIFPSGEEKDLIVTRYSKFEINKIH